MSAKTDMMTADLRWVIDEEDTESDVTVVWNGSTIVGTRGEVDADAVFDPDGGGENTSDDFSAAFLLVDWPSIPVGDEIVSVDGVAKRIYKVRVDDLNVAIVIDFKTPTVIN